MNRRSILTLAVILTSNVSGCVHTGRSSEGVSTALGVATRRPVPITKTEERYRDNEGVELILSRDETGKVTARAVTKDRKDYDVKEVPFEGKASVCIPEGGVSEAAGAGGARGRCHVVSFVTDGAFIKLDDKSCTCYVCNGIAYCYGTTC